MVVKKAIYPGTFDPITYGHLDIIIRSNKIFDEILIAVAENTQKDPLFDLQERVFFIKKATQSLSNLTVFGFNDLIVNIIKKQKVNILIRGFRTISDLEYEMRFFKVNRYFIPEIETIFMMSSDKWEFVSSKLIKEMAQYGGQINKFIPDFIAERMMEKLFIAVE